MDNETVTELKKAYNNALRAARAATKASIRLREQIIAACPQYSGPSMAKLETAHDNLTEARRFNLD